MVKTTLRPPPTVPDRGPAQRGRRARVLRFAGSSLATLGLSALFIVSLGVAPVAGLAVVFLLRYAGVKRRPVDLALLAQCVVMPITVALAGPERLNAALRVWYVLLGLQMLAALYYEPLWVFYRDAGTITRLNQLRAKRIAVSFGRCLP